MLNAFKRWPTWMWANEEVVRLPLAARAQRRPPATTGVGFYGLDVYSLWDSLDVFFATCGEDDRGPGGGAAAFRCFEPYGEDAQDYAPRHGSCRRRCEDEVVALLARTRGTGGAATAPGRFAANRTPVVAGAERYYRTMVRGGPRSWNVRDRHMMETLDRLMAHHGPGPRAIVWEHNTHVGDARFTDMADDGMVNVGQLARERHGDDEVVLVGFGSYQGT